MLNDLCCQNPLGAFTATFTDFTSGTIAWGTGILFPPFSIRNYDIEVIGNSGTLTLDDYSSVPLHGPPGFFGVYDPAGLVSVSIRGTDSSFFDVTTVAIPEPFTSTTVATVLTILAILLRHKQRRRRRRIEIATYQRTRPNPPNLFRPSRSILQVGLSRPRESVQIIVR